MEKRIAILIDADNTSCDFVEHIFDEVSELGLISVKRIYADWTTPQNQKWKEILNNYAIKPIQKFAYTTGKNSTDIALVIDAMDLLHSQKIDIFCLVSSDSDYTGLAHRIREEGLQIIGIGKNTTPTAFKVACNQFFKIGLIEKEQKEQPKAIPYDIIDIAFGKVHKENGLALLSRFREAIISVSPTFNYKHYGYKKFSDFCRNLTGYTIYQHNQTFSIKKLEK